MSYNRSPMELGTGTMTLALNILHGSIPHTKAPLMRVPAPSRHPMSSSEAAIPVIMLIPTVTSGK